MKSLFEKNNLIIGITLLVASLLLLTILDVQSQTSMCEQSLLPKKCLQTSVQLPASKGSKTVALGSLKVQGNPCDKTCQQNKLFVSIINVSHVKLIVS